ncbi:MAG: phosphoribosyltransferase [Rhodoferax sp.]
MVSVVLWHDGLVLRNGLRVKMRWMSKLMPPPRTPWGNFPDVLIHAGESAVKQHPAYKAAKAGSDDAATVLVLDTFNGDSASALAAIAGDRKPTLVSAHALEREGVNAIPEVFADRLSQVLQWPADKNVVQVNVVSHTGANGFWRLARQAEFDGPVQPGCLYVLVDDFVGMGGTLANLKGYIESHGGVVLAAVSLTGKPHSAKLTPTSERLHELRMKHGTELENWWYSQFAHTFDALTESEARYLARTETADTIRNRIAAAE